MSKFSVKNPYTVFVAVVICLILGVVSFTRMSTDLLPEFSLPYVVVVTTYPGASPDKVESTVTEPLESGLGTVNGVENVTSTSNENYCTVMLEFAEETNMEEARLTAYLFQRLQDAVFLTERNMAEQLGLSYKVLRRVQKAQRMTQKTADAMERLLQYCVRNQIPLDRYLSEYR